MEALADRVDSALNRGDFAAALRLVAPRLPRGRLAPRVDSFYTFVGDQDLLPADPRRPLTREELALARAGLSGLTGPRRQILSGYALLCARRHRQARRIFAEQARSRPADPLPPLLEACALWLQGDRERVRHYLPQALARAERAVELASSREALLLRAQIRFEHEDNEGGLKDLSRLLRLYPNDVSTRIGRAEIFADLHRYPQALRDLNWVRRRRGSSWWLFAQRGRLRGMCGKPALALKDFDRAICLRERHGALYSWRAEVLRKLGRYALARRDAGLAVSLEPGYAFGWEISGRLKLMTGEARGAFKDLDSACRLDRAHSLAFAWRAEAAWKLGRWRTAWEDFERIYPLNPLNTWNASGLREGQIPSRASRVLAFENDLDLAVARSADEAVVWILRGRLRILRGLVAPGLADLARALDLSGPPGAALGWRGWARLREGDPRGAESDLREAVRQAPGNPRWRAWRGSALLRLGRDEEAMTELDAALEAPQQALAEVFVERGDYWERVGERTRARADYRMAHLLDPKHAATRRTWAP